MEIKSKEYQKSTKQPSLSNITTTYKLYVNVFTHIHTHHRLFAVNYSKETETIYFVIRRVALFSKTAK